MLNKTPPRAEILRRKDEHLDVILSGDARFESLSAGFDALRLPHCAAPELALEEVDLSCRFLGNELRAPILVSSMTGGPARAETINRNLAEAVEDLGLAMGVGSQRVALEGAGDGGVGAALRKSAPSAPLYANFGAAQLAKGFGVEHAKRAIDAIEADALFIHFNPLQEAVQPGGDTDWRGVLAGLEALANGLETPIICKEVGFGISGRMAKRLIDAGASAIDVAGAGGSHWAKVEAARAPTSFEAKVAAAFDDWGVPTAQALQEVRAIAPQIPLIASGGVRHGVDAAKALALGANLVGQAAGVLGPATSSAQAAHEALRVMVEQLRAACFCSGVARAQDLQLA